MIVRGASGLPAHAEAAFFALHPALGAVRRRVRLRSVVGQIERGALIAFGGAVLVAVIGRTLAWPLWSATALAWALAVPLVWATGAALRRPDSWRVARAADALGLEERVTSTLHALRSGDGGAASLLAADTAAHLASIDPSAVPIGGEVRRRWMAALLGGLLLLAAFAPLPPIGPWRAAARRAADAQSTAAARQAVQALQARLPEAQHDALARSRAEELRRLAGELRRAQSADQASRAIEASQERLASLPQQEDYARQRAIEAAATQLARAQQPDLAALSRALRSGDAQAIQASDLAARLGSLTPDERLQLQSALQAAANAARDVPSLAEALRDAARATAGDSSDPAAASSSAQAIQDATTQLAEAAERAAALRELQEAVTRLGDMRASLASGIFSSLPPGTQATAGQFQLTGTPVAISGTVVPASATGTPVGLVLVPGNVAAQGQPGQQGQAAQGGSVVGGGGASPNGPRPYDPAAPPTLLGGDDGARLRASGEASGATGAGVALPSSPLALGADRPYDQVYADYEASARQTVSRQELPPPLRGLVQRYFTSIEPGAGQ